MAAEERAKQHHVLASRLEATLSEATRELPSRGSSVSDGAFLELEPRRRFGSLELPDVVREETAQIVEEHERSDLLRSYGLEPRHRLLLSGPPGNGKTSLAEALATELALPFFVADYDQLVGSYLGETAVRLARLFETVRSRQCVVFFDEFETLAKERGDEHDSGEIKRVVSSLLLHIDRLPSYTLIIVATNHPELLDRAAWRRFQVALELPMPSRGQREQWFGQHLGLSPRLSLTRRLVDAFEGASFSELEGFVLDYRRRMVLDGGAADGLEISRALLRRREARPNTGLT